MEINGAKQMSDLKVFTVKVFELLSRLNIVFLSRKPLPSSIKILAQIYRLESLHYIFYIDKGVVICFENEIEGDVPRFENILEAPHDFSGQLSVRISLRITYDVTESSFFFCNILF